MSPVHYLGDSIAPPQENETHAPVFTGSGKEYFRIWIVNLCLTIATLGIYSAWAKVRRLQYFDRNTQLDCATFDFHGDPKTILKGRVIAAILLITYNYAFGFSKQFGVAVLVFLFLGLPWMLRGALRFRSHNTSYRGLRFQFGGSLVGAYRTYLPVMLVFFLPTLVVTVFPKQVAWLGLSFLLYLLWPFFHAQIKRYQQGHLAYGSNRAAYEVSGGKFFARYFTAVLVGLLGLVIAGVITGLATVLLKSKEPDYYMAFLIPGIMMTGSAYAIYLLAGPYLQASIYNLTWSNTRFRDVTIDSHLSKMGYIKLQTVNVILTVLTLGLYRPFAVVRAYRYRLTHTSICTTGAFDSVLAGEQRQSMGASGDSAADFLGFDLSW